jgi:glycosyltransferase involved in cell wall biosynthesis
MFVSINHNNIVTASSDKHFIVAGQKTLKVDVPQGMSLIGKVFRPKNTIKSMSDMKIAIVCNWQTKCGISTYSSYLVNALRKQVKEVRIFSEYAATKTAEDGPDVDRCWRRGESLVGLSKKIKQWNPDFVIIQHEFGIFPNAFFFMQLMQFLENIPHVVTLHSVYEHLDKIVYSASIRNIIVHTQQGKDVLRKMGNTNQIFVIPHGCVEFPDAQELWNIMQNPYTVMQFGFGFAYKGVDRALNAIHYLKTSDQKFANIFYFYLISDNDFNSRVHLEYYETLCSKVRELGLDDNVVIYRKYQSEQMLNLYLRLAKLAIFPYINNPHNTVYGSSGAIRIALANKCPVIASESHLFDDLNTIVPRPDSHIALASEIDRVFSNNNYRQQLIERGQEFISKNSWDEVANQYLALIESVK